MRKLFIICAVIFQIVLLSFMAGEKEAVLRKGKVIQLRTIPIDPRDYFRGDYVRLDYEISEINYDKLRDGLKIIKPYRQDRDKKVYAMLEVNDENVANLLYATDKKPEKGQLFIRGRLDFNLEDRIEVRYGIESYFLEQNKGKELEDRKFKNHRASLEMTVALGSNGTAVIKDYHWSPISIEIDDLKLKKNSPQQANIILTNISEKPVAIVILNDFHSLKIKQRRRRWRNENNWQWITEANAAYLPEDKHVHILEPSQSYEIQIDFNNPYWSISVNDKQTKLISEHRFINSPSFRIVYSPPSAKQCENLKNTDLIWHGKISSETIPGLD